MTHSQHDLECLQAQNPGTPHVSPVKQTGTLVLSPRSRRNDQSAERAERALRARHSLSLVRSVPGHVQVWWCQTANSQKPSRYWFRLPHLTQTSWLHDTFPSNVTLGVSPVSVSMFHGHTCTCVFGQVPCPAALPASHHTTQDRGQCLRAASVNPKKLSTSPPFNDTGVESVSVTPYWLPNTHRPAHSG